MRNAHCVENRSIPCARTFAENGGGRIVFTKTWQDYSVASSTDNDLDFLVIEQACRYQDCIVQLDTHLVWGGNNPNGYFSLQESTDKSTWRQLRVLSLRDEPEANLEDEESEMSVRLLPR